MTLRAHRALPYALAALVLAAGCGGSSKSPASPEVVTGPSTDATQPPASGSGASIAGLVTSAASSSAASMSAGMSGVTVSIANTGMHTSTDAAGHFSFTHVPSGHVELQFSGPANGSVSIENVGEQESIDIEVQIHGGVLEVEHEERSNGAEGELEGKIASVNGGAHSFVVGQFTVTVADGIEISDGFRALSFSDLVVGARVHVKGTASGNSIAASRIEVQQSQLEKGEAHGTASDFGGACPDRTFQIGSQHVSVNDSTLFVKGTCADLTGSPKVEVKGLQRPDGSLLATQVKFEDDHGNGGDDNGDDNGGATETEFTGSVSGLGGSCPALTFSAGGHAVKTTAATSFEVSCALIADGLKVAVKGNSAAGVVTATRVKKEN